VLFGHTDRTVSDGLGHLSSEGDILDVEVPFHEGFQGLMSLLTVGVHPLGFLLHEAEDGSLLGNLVFLALSHDAFFLIVAGPTRSSPEPPRLSPLDLVPSYWALHGSPSR